MSETPTEVEISSFQAQRTTLQKPAGLCGGLAGARHLRLGVLDLGLVVRELGLERGDRRLEVLNGRPVGTRG